MELKLIFEGKEAGNKVKENMDKAGQMVRESMRAAAKDAAQEIEARMADDIEAAGNFGSRWQDAPHADIEETQRTIRITARMQGGPPVSYWRVFEYGAHIQAKNPSGLMWLPFSDAKDAQGLWPRAYGSDRLFRIDSKAGLPMLFDRESRKPLYHGHESVTIPQKFHLREVIREVARELRTYYAEHMKG